MDKKTVAIIVTVLALLLCGCPGLSSLFMGGLFAIISFIPGAEIDVLGNSDPQSALYFGLGSMCVGLIGTLIAAAAIFIAWRRAKNNAEVAPQTQA